MINRYYKVTVFILLVLLNVSRPCLADTELETKFQDMFVTAGYSAAAGAAIGAALLTFQDDPTKHLKFISIGASLGFLGGTALGSWVALAPVFVDNTAPKPFQFAQNVKRHDSLIVRPWMDITTKNLVGIEAGAIFASF